MKLRCTTGSEAWRTIAGAAETQRAAAWQYEPGADQPPALILGVARAEALWAEVLAKCDELVPSGDSRGSSRSRAAYEEDGKGCIATLTRHNHDGTATVWSVQAHEVPGRSVTVSVHGPWTDSHDAEWERRARSDRSRVVIAGHCWFSLAGSGPPRGMRGFGGRKFRFTSVGRPGEEVTHDDVWFGGVIPPAWRDRLPDTHVMAEGMYPGPVE